MKMIVRERIGFEIVDTTEMYVKEGIQKALDKLYKEHMHIQDIKMISHGNEIIVYGRYKEVLED